MSEAAAQPSDALVTQAYAQLHAGHIEDAVELFSAALTSTPQHAEALRGRGVAYLQLQRWAFAAADFDAARRLAPEALENWADLSIALAADHNMYPAIEVLETVIAKHPEYVRGYVELGALHIRLGAIPKGRHYLQEALTHRPTLEQRRSIGALLQEQDRLDRKRYYRPDFEALRKQRQRNAAEGSRWTTAVRSLLKRLRRSTPGS